MAVGIATQYPTKSESADADYPFGSGRNITVPSDGTGTPFEKAWFNDYVGFFSSLLNEVGETPSGNPDTILVPQYLNALRKGRVLVDARAFGAVGDGATDNTTALQAAIDYINGLSGGGCVAIVSGIYVSDKLVVKSNVHLLGVGGTLELKDNADSSLLEIPVGADLVRIENLILDGNSINNVGTVNDIGLLHVLSTNVAPTTNCLVQGCQINDAYQDGVHLTDGTTRFRLTNNLIDGTTVGDGIKLSQLTPTLDTLIDTVVMGNQVTNAEKHCLHCDGVMLGLVVSHNFFDGTGSDGTSSVVRIRNSSTKSVLFSDNIVENGATNGVLIGTKTLVCSNNQIRNFESKGISVNTAGIGDDVRECVIDGNTIIGGLSATDGISVIECLVCSITGNTIRDCPDGIDINARQFAIVGNTIKGASSRGILLTKGVSSVGGTVVGNTVIGIAPGSSLTGINLGTMEECACTGNRVTDATNGIVEAGGADFNAIVGNVARGNTTPITVVGAGTISASNVV